MDALADTSLLPPGFRESFMRGDVGIALLVDRVKLSGRFNTETHDIERDVDVRAHDGLWRVTIPEWETRSYCPRNGSVSLRLAHDGIVDGVLQFVGASWSVLDGSLVIAAKERASWMNTR